MSPIHRTPEYILLTELSDGLEHVVDKLNVKVLADAINEGYVTTDTSQDFAHITTAGYSRLEELENGN